MVRVLMVMGWVDGKTVVGLLGVVYGIYNAC